MDSPTLPPGGATHPATRTHPAAPRPRRSLHRLGARSRPTLCGLLCVLSACERDPAPQDGWSPSPGQLDVGVSQTSVEGETQGGPRTVQLTLWYPTDAPPGTPRGTTSLRELVDDHELPPGTLEDALAPAIAAGCAEPTAPATQGAPPSATARPTLVYSHCHACLPVYGAFLAHHLASRGWVVIGVHHDGASLVDLLAGDAAPLTNPTLDGQVDDVRIAIEALLAGALPVPAPSGLPALAGHSFGAVTMGRVAEHVDIAAGIAMAAPVDNPILRTIAAADLPAPWMFAAAGEDNSIYEAGNILIRRNFDAAPPPALLVEHPNAGHWSFASWAGVVPSQQAGCGEATRQTDGSPFTPAPPADVRTWLAERVTAFLDATVLEDPDAAAWLIDPPDDGTTLRWRGP